MWNQYQYRRWYQQQRRDGLNLVELCCDLLENSYLCGISNNCLVYNKLWRNVVICLKIRTFVVSATTASLHQRWTHRLWFAWKFVPLWYQQQHKLQAPLTTTGCDLLENSYLCGISNNYLQIAHTLNRLWFAWKFVPLWYQQQPDLLINGVSCSCDLLENSYLCGISNNQRVW